MKYFLIQVSKQGIYDLLYHGLYINKRWEISGKDQKLVQPNDCLIFYFTSEVPMFKQQIRFIYQVTEVSDDLATIKVKLYVEIEPVQLRDLGGLINKKIISDKFLRCSIQGFNISMITNSDFDFLSSRKIARLKETDLKGIKEMFLDLGPLRQVDEDVKEQVEVRSDLNLLYMASTGLIKLDRKDRKKLQEFEVKGYIKIENDKILITKKGNNAIKIHFKNQRQR